MRAALTLRRVNLAMSLGFPLVTQIEVVAAIVCKSLVDVVVISLCLKLQRSPGIHRCGRCSTSCQSEQ